MSDRVTDEALIADARKASRAVFLATDETVASDLSRILSGLADALEAALSVSPVPPAENDEECECHDTALEHLQAAYDGVVAEYAKFRAAARRSSPVETAAPKGVHFECNCVPQLGPSHCHACGEIAGRPVPWSETVHAPVETVSTVEELDALPVGTVVRKAPEDSTRIDYEDGSWQQGAIAELRPDRGGRPAWFIVGLALGYRSHQADLLPASVLFRPDTENGENRG